MDSGLALRAPRNDGKGLLKGRNRLGKPSQRGIETLECASNPKASPCEFLRILAVMLLFAVVPSSSRATTIHRPKACRPPPHCSRCCRRISMRQIVGQMDNLVWPMLETTRPRRQDRRRDRRRTAPGIRNARRSKNLCRHHEGRRRRSMRGISPSTNCTSSSPSTKSPVGAKAMRELPQVMAEFVATITPRLRDMQQQCVEGFQRYPARSTAI